LSSSLLARTYPGAPPLVFAVRNGVMVGIEVRMFLLINIQQAHLISHLTHGYGDPKPIPVSVHTHFYSVTGMLVLVFQSGE
jgi:hypothetical protein